MYLGVNFNSNIKTNRMYKLSNEQKRWLASSAVTFVSGFLFSLGMQIQNLNLQTISWSVVGVAILTGVRAGVKAIYEKKIYKKPTLN